MTGSLASRARDRTGRSAPSEWTARRHLLPQGESIDPWDLAGQDGIVSADGGRVLVGLGTAFRIDLPGGLGDADTIHQVSTRLAGVPCDDGVPSGLTLLRPVLAFGALPFDSRQATSLVVPATLFCREADGTGWATVLSGPDDGEMIDDSPERTGAVLAERARAVRAARGGDDPTTYTVTAHDTDAAFEDRVNRAVASIGRSAVDKVVLARRVDVTVDAPPDLPTLLRRWSQLEPSCTLFSFPTPDGQFVGASPELLVEQHGREFSSRPLAGTTERVHRDDSTLPAALLDSTKDAAEHRLVVEAIRHGLAPLSDRLDEPPGPELVHLHTITHLGTALSGTLRAAPDGSVPGVLDLVAVLHPTPAVGGSPRADALALLADLEDHSRGAYAGPVGWIDAAGDGRWVVGIRAMIVADRTVMLTAGVGIVADSRPEVERREVDLKFTAVFDALAPGVAFDPSPAAEPPDASLRT